jgi:hypothetical protein
LQTNTHEEFGGYCKRHIMLYTILGEFEDSGGSWIQYWTRVHIALTDLHQDSALTMRYGFWPQIHVDVQASKVSLLGNEKVRKEFMWTTIALGLLVPSPTIFPYCSGLS